MTHAQAQLNVQTKTETATAPQPRQRADSFFTPIGNTKPYFKAALEGFAGSGKTYTAAQLAIGLHQRIGSTKPVVIFDTEKAAKFLKPLFADANIEVLVRESKSLADLRETMRRMREAAISDVLIIDSISHVWEGFLQTYAQKVKRTRLEFQDWGIIKPTWKREFSDPFVGDPYHVIMCGRAGYEYENEVNKETGKREIFKSGVKMKVEGETAYEPDMLILMERFEEILTDDKRVWRLATVIKDRSAILDGKTFENPTYQHFEPAIEAMLANPTAIDVFLDPEHDTGLLFRTEEEKGEWRRERDKAMEELDGLLTRIAPGATGKDKQLKLDLLDKVFSTTSLTAIAEMKPREIMDGYKRIGLEAVALGIAENGALVKAPVAMYYGNGSDGALTVTGATTINATKTKVNAASASGQKVVSVASTTGFAVGNKVLIHQTQGTGAGLWEIGHVDSIQAGTSLTMRDNLNNSYGVTGAQVVKVPQYTTIVFKTGASISDGAWNQTNGYGGIILAYASKGVIIEDGPYPTNGRRLKIKGVGEMLRHYANRAGIPYQNAHSFRHHMGHDIIKKGGSAADVMNLLGHATLASASIYTMMTDQELEGRYRKFKGN